MNDRAVEGGVAKNMRTILLRVLSCCFLLDTLCHHYSPHLGAKQRLCLVDPSVG